MDHRNHRRPRQAFLSLMDGLEERTSSASLALGILPAAALAVLDAAAASATAQSNDDGPGKDGFTPAKPASADAGATTTPPAAIALGDAPARATAEQQAGAIRPMGGGLVRLTGSASAPAVAPPRVPTPVGLSAKAGA